LLRVQDKAKYSAFESKGPR